MMSALEEDQFLLAYTMSNISELGWSASWMQNLEYILWHAVISGRRNFGRVAIDSDHITALKLLSNRVGGWIYYDAEEEETYISLTEWQLKYEKVTQADPNVLS
jgi:hypothetical protein